MAALQQQDLDNVLANATPQQLASVAEGALEKIPAKERKEVVRKAGGLGGPSQWVSDWIWLLVVLGFLLTMIGAVATLLQGRFVTMTPGEGAIFTSTETLITLFTTTTAFLAGLLSPSPVRGQGEQ